MKTRNFVMLIASLGLVFGMMTGCGGGGSDDGDGGVTPPSAGFTPEKIDEQVGQIADQLGCDYVKATTAQDKEDGLALSFKTAKIISDVIENKKDLPLLAVTETTPGTCGGTLTIDGDDLFSASYTFSDYCTEDPETGIKIEIDGSLEASSNEAGDVITASTPTPLTVTSNNPNTGENVSVTVDLDSATLTANEDGSMKIDITTLTIKDNNEGKTYGIRSFVANINLETGSIDFNGTFDNPNLDVGSLNVNGIIDGSTGEGHITAIDTNGVKVELTTTNTEGVLDVIYDGAPLGTMDCSMAELPI